MLLSRLLTSSAVILSATRTTAPLLVSAAHSSIPHLNSAIRNSKSRTMSTAPPVATKGIQLYSFPTPNGVKISIALEELRALGSDIEWTEHSVNIMKNESKEPWFLEINPNGRIPAMIDRDRNNARTWESGSMLLYLAKYRDSDFLLHFKDEQDENEMINWIMFQMGGLGPMAGQANHFIGAAPVKIPYAAKRYIDETKRLLQVYEQQLQGKEYLIGAGKGKYSYADIASIGWARASALVFGVTSLDKVGLPNVQAWVDRCMARPGTRKGIPQGDFVEKMVSGVDAEQKLKDRVAFAFAEDEKKKDEL